MFDENILKDIIVQSGRKFPMSLVKRSKWWTEDRYLGSKEVVAILGVRRSGKTYLMYSMVNDLLEKGVPANNILYINFEDERLVMFTSEDLERFYQAFLETQAPKGRTYLFLDEVQNIPFWEKWIARMYDRDVKFVVTGSGSALLSREYSTALTGRNVPITVYPFSFEEYLSIKDPVVARESLSSISHVTENRARVRRWFQEFLRNGGFPEVVLGRGTRGGRMDDEGNTERLGTYFKDIVARDIIMKRNIRYVKSMLDLARFLVTQSSSLASYSRLRSLIDARGINTVKNYVQYLEEAHLIFRVPFFSHSPKQQIYNPFKVYCIDTGLRNAVGFRADRDLGRQAENAVYLELRRRGAEIYYWKDGKDREVDFVLADGPVVKDLVQVCWDVTDQGTRDRELPPLIAAAKKFGKRECQVLTGGHEAVETHEGVKVHFRPVWIWMLERGPSEKKKRTVS